MENISLQRKPEMTTCTLTNMPPTHFWIPIQKYAPALGSMDICTGVGKGEAMGVSLIAALVTSTEKHGETGKQQQTHCYHQDRQDTGFSLRDTLRTHYINVTVNLIN